MLKLIFADNTEQEILDQTTVYPSTNSFQRSRMEIHMPADAMGLEAFAALMSDPEKTKTLQICQTDEQGQLVRSTLYTAYTLPSRLGCERVETVNHTDAATTTETHLVAVLEQLTFIEQQLAALGVNLQ